MTQSDNVSNAPEPERGRIAVRPGEIPRKGWRDILVRVKNQIFEDNLNIVAAGVSFYTFLSLFPAIIAAITIYALAVEPQTVQQQLQALTGVLPEQARELIGNQLTTIAKQASGTLGWGVAVSIFIGLWSANKGMKALFQGLNIVYTEGPKRGFFKQNALTLLFTFLGIILAIICAAFIVALPVVFKWLGLPQVLEFALGGVRWLVLTVLLLFSLAVLYRFAPDRHAAKWRWVSWGSVAATLLWLAASWALSFFVANFGRYNQMYGSVAAVVILLMWLLLSNYAILLGAELDSEMEGQTRKDSTTDPEQPMGERGAYHADNLSEKP